MRILRRLRRAGKRRDCSARMRRVQRADAFVFAHAAQHALHLAARAQKLIFPRIGAAAGHIVYCVVARDNHQRGKQRLSIAARPDSGQHMLKQRIPFDRTDKHIRIPIALKR